MSHISSDLWPIELPKKKTIDVIPSQLMSINRCYPQKGYSTIAMEQMLVVLAGQIPSMVEVKHISAERNRAVEWTL